MDSNQKNDFITDSQLYRLMQSCDMLITKNLNEYGIETRPASSNGLWCCILLPTILLLYSLEHKVSLLYSLLTCISIGFLCYCLLFNVFMSVSCLVLRDNIAGGCSVAGLVSALLMYTILDQSLMFSIIYSFISVSSFRTLLKTSLLWFPKTFSIGEAMVVVQGIVLFIIMMLTRMWYGLGDHSDNEAEFVFAVTFTILSSVGIIVTALVVLGDEPKDMQTLCYVGCIGGTYALVMLHIHLGIDCIIQLASYLFGDTMKVELFLFWFCLCIVAGVVITVRTRMAVKADTVTRKVFHLLASVVFMSGIILDVHLMTLAAGVGLGLVILVEALRKTNVESVSPALESAFRVYSDSKDAGCFAMTPIYLYVGLACPLALVPAHRSDHLELLSGVLSIGVGDTAASWFGSKYGRNKWEGGQKTLEGTIFNVLSQIVMVYVLNNIFGVLHGHNSLPRTVLAASLSALVEAKTDQIDNLILPLVTIIAFQLTWFLS